MALSSRGTSLGFLLAKKRWLSLLADSEALKTSKNKKKGTDLSAPPYKHYITMIFIYWMKTTDSDHSSIG